MTLADTVLAALADIAAHQPPRVNLWLGAWSGATTYATGDVVGWAGASYTALAASTGAQPDITPGTWGLVADIGVPGNATPLSGHRVMTYNGDGNPLTETWWTDASHMTDPYLKYRLTLSYDIGGLLTGRVAEFYNPPGTLVRTLTDSSITLDGSANELTCTRAES